MKTFKFKRKSEINVHEKEKCSVRVLTKNFSISKMWMNEILRNKKEILKFWFRNYNLPSKLKFRSILGLKMDMMIFA